MAIQWPSVSSIPSTPARFVVTVQTAAVFKYESDVPFFSIIILHFLYLIHVSLFLFFISPSFCAYLFLVTFLCCWKVCTMKPPSYANN